MFRGIFDADHYRRQSGQELDEAEALDHFQTRGDDMGLDPSPYFSTAFYKKSYPNWDKRGARTALEDFLFRIGRGEKRWPHPLINPDYYRAQYEDLAGLGPEVALHFILHGDGEGRTPSASFDAGFYRRCYLPLGAGKPLSHYVTSGAALGYLPRPVQPDRERSADRMRQAIAGLVRPLLLVAHDAQAAGVPILTRDLGRALRARGWDPVFLLGNAGPMLEEFRRLGPVLIRAEGHDVKGLAAGLPQGCPVLVNTAAAADLAGPLASAGLNCLLMIHEMPDHLREHGLMPHLRKARAAGARLVASMPRMVQDLALDPGGVTLLRPGILRPPTALSAFRQLRAWRRERAGPVFISAGHADLRKGFDLFLDAARRIAAVTPAARFVWLGALDAWAQNLANVARADGLSLTLPGFVSDSLAWYRMADVYLLTSRQDPGPTTVIHAAAVGTPFVGYAADIGIVGLADGAGQFLPPGDEAGFVAAALAASEEVTPAARRRVRRHIRTEADFDTYVSAILARFAQSEGGAV